MKIENLSVEDIEAFLLSPKIRLDLRDELLDMVSAAKAKTAKVRMLSGELPLVTYPGSYMMEDTCLDSLDDPFVVCKWPDGTGRALVRYVGGDKGFEITKGEVRFYRPSLAEWLNSGGRADGAC